MQIKEKEKKQLIILGVCVVILVVSFIATNTAPNGAVINSKGNVFDLPALKMKVAADSQGAAGVPGKPGTYNNGNGPGGIQAAPDVTGIGKQNVAAEVKYAGRSGRDPFDPGPLRIKTVPQQDHAAVSREPVFSKENLTVSAVIWGSQKPQAIINGKIVDIGASINGGEIITIDKQGVHVNYQGKEVLIPIK